MASINHLLLKEAKALHSQGYIPIIQSKTFVLAPDGSHKKVVIKSQVYKCQPEHTHALENLRRYLYCNPNSGGIASNTLGILMNDFVNLDFDNMDEYHSFLQTGLIQHYTVTDTKVNKTPNGLHYLYLVPDHWIGKYKKTTHVGGSHIDVLFGSGTIEHVYPSYVLHPVHGLLTYQKVNDNLIQPMPDALRLYLEPLLGTFSPSTSTSLSVPAVSDDPFVASILLKLADFGYVNPFFVRSKSNVEGFDFGYDHSFPDPLNPSVTHDRVDGYIIINRSDNVVIVGSYSSLCPAKILCPVIQYDFDHIPFSTDVCGLPTIQYHNQYVLPFTDVHLSNPISVSLIKSDMGTGKSHQVRQHIVLHDPPSILILTPRILFARSILLSLNLGRSIPFQLYTDINDTVITSPFLICQMESIWKIARTYDFIYVDEIESCLATFSSETMYKFGKLPDCVRRFQYLLSSAKRIVLCDAHISTRTTDLLHTLGFHNDQVLLEINTFQPNQRNAIEVPYSPSNGDQLIQVALSQLRHGKNIVFACSSKSFILEKLQPAIVALLPPSDFIFYTADSPEADKLALVDGVEHIWSSKRFVGYNTAISVGIDFNIEHFHTLFVYAMNYGCGPVRDIFQSMHRVRKLKDNLLYYSICSKSHVSKPIISKSMALDFIHKTSLLSSDFVTDDLQNAPQWLMDLHIHNLLEKGLSQAYFSKVFQQHLLLCGYSNLTSLEAEHSESTSLLDSVAPSEASVSLAFDDIPSIDPHDVSQLMSLHKKIYSKQASSVEEAVWRKYVYTKIGFTDASNFDLMQSKQDKRKLINYSLERARDPKLLVSSQLDYSDLANIESLKIVTTKQLCDTLGFSDSADGDTVISKKTLIDNQPVLKTILTNINVLNCNKTYIKDDYESLKKAVSNALKQHSGSTLVNVKSASGKSPACVTINGVQYQKLKLQPIINRNGFTVPSKEFDINQLCV